MRVETVSTKNSVNAIRVMYTRQLGEKKVSD